MKLLLKKILLYAFSLVSYVVPKKKNLWVFSPKHYNNRFEGNIRHLFCYMAGSVGDISIWCIKISKKEIARHEVLRGRASSGRLTFRSMWMSLRAEVIVLDSGDPLFKGNFKVVQLWHGTGFKNIGVFGEKYYGKRVRRLDKEIIFILASSEIDKKRKRESFLNDNVYITGSPRNDFLFYSDDDEKIKNLLGVQHFSKLILYAPTFREVEQRAPFSESFWQHLEAALKEQNAAFIIKRHPRDTLLAVPKGIPNILDITGSVSDVQEVLRISDVIISDYSGIVNDYAVLGRPMVFYMYDYDEYILSCRDFYYDLKEVLPGPFARSEHDLIDLIMDCSWFEVSDYKKHYDDFVDFFQKYRDGKSSKRVVNTVRALLQD